LSSLVGWGLDKSGAETSLYQIRYINVSRTRNPTT
jgi:hypothetical protein